MTLAIMQPYFLPYIGYWQLIASVDVFVVYDNIKYTKKGWINRNRILVNGKDEIFTLPLKRDSDHLDIVQRELAGDFDRRKILNQFEGAYRRAPYFEQTWSLLETVIQYGDDNLFRYIFHSIEQLCTYMRIGTQIQVSSGIPIDHSLKAQDKVIAICESLGATKYINAIGGTNLYSSATFEKSGISLNFLNTNPITYQQFTASFIPALSIVDLLMFNSTSSIQHMIAKEYSIL